MNVSGFWFRADVTPPEVDIYLVQVPYIPGGEAYALWDGERWLCWATSPEKAELVAIGGPAQGYPWQPVEWKQVV